MRMLVLLSALPIAGWSVAAEPVAIVADGNPKAAVVIPHDAPGQVQTAADVLVSCVEQSSGATLPLLNQPPASGNSIFIGPQADASDIDQSDLDDDGFDIAFPDEQTIVILGPTPSGTEFGVYEFLERYVGVRWLMPGTDGTDIPAHTSISVEATPVRQEPAFFSRLFSGLRGGAQRDWARRNRMHGRVSFHHNLLSLFPPETYTQTHPEFFPIQNGERFLPPTNNTHRWQPCFTAPGIVEEAVKNITAYFDEHPDAPSYSLGTNDSGGYCECDRCLARISGDENFLGRTDYSDLFYAWANDVIEGVLKQHPDRVFGCLAYSEVAAPPARVSVHPRLIPYMTYDRMKWADPDIRATGEQFTKAWHDSSPVVGWYDYIYGTPYVLPRVWFHHMADYYRFGHANGVRALYAEAYPNWGEGPKLYVSLKLQWDPSRDVDELLEEWYARCVGEQAAPYLARYYAHWEDFWTRRVLQSNWFTAGGQYLNFSSPQYLDDISLDEIRQSRTLLETAVAKAITDAQKARAGLLLRAFEYYEATAYAYKPEAVPAGVAVTTQQQALTVLNEAERRIDSADRRRHLALEVFPDHPVLVHPITITRGSLLRGDDWGAGGLWRVYDMAAEADGPVRRRVRDLSKSAESALVRGQAAMMLALIDGGLEPLTRNHSFEDGDDANADEWDWWVKWGVGAMSRTDETAHTGTYSVLCDGMKRGGPVQALDITPGKYGLVCFVLIPEGQEAAGTVELAMTLRNAAGTNLPSAATKTTPPQGRWTAVAVAADVPATIGDDEVTTVMPILIVDGFGTGDRVYLDDLLLYRMGD